MTVTKKMKSCFVALIALQFLGVSAQEAVANENRASEFRVQDGANNNIQQVIGQDVPESFLRHGRRDLQEEDNLPWKEEETPLLVDTINVLGETTVFNQNEYDGRDATVLVAQISPTIVANSDIQCTLRCTDDTFDEVILNLKYGSPPTDVTTDGTRYVLDKCPITLGSTTHTTQTLYVSVAQSQGPMNDGRLECKNNRSPSPVPTPTPTNAPTEPIQICFSEESTVQVQGKGTVTMKDLQVDDKVYVGNKDNTPQYEAVYAFGHHHKTAATEFLRIHTKSSSALEISAAHLLHVAGKATPIRADEVKLGDILLQKTLDAPASIVYVTKVERVVSYGAYMPLTKSGTIVVNDYQVSAYVSIFEEAPRVITKFQGLLSEQELLHWWLAPYRMVCGGISSKLCENDYNDEGIAYWLVLGRHIARVGDEWPLVFQAFGLAVVTLFMAACMALELLIGRFWTFGFMCFLVVLARGRGRVGRKAKAE